MTRQELIKRMNYREAKEGDFYCTWCEHFHSEIHIGEFWNFCFCHVQDVPSDTKMICDYFKFDNSMK